MRESRAYSFEKSLALTLAISEAKVGTAFQAASKRIEPVFIPQRQSYIGATTQATGIGPKRK